MLENAEPYVISVDETFFSGLTMSPLDVQRMYGDAFIRTFQTGL